MSGAVSLQKFLLLRKWKAQRRKYPIQRNLTINDSGLMLGTTVLAKFTGQKLCIDKQRLLTLLSVAYGTPVSPKIIGNIRSAEKAYKQGNAALAQMHLALTGLPAIDTHDTPERLFMAEQLLKWGTTPYEVLNCIGINDALENESAKALLKYLRKFNPYHRGPGPDGGQFTTADNAAGEYQVAANDGTPGNNQVQNKQVRDIARKLNLTDDQIERLHERISGRNLGYHDIMGEARDEFDK